MKNKHPSEFESYRLFIKFLFYGLGIFLILWIVISVSTQAFDYNSDMTHSSNLISSQNK